MSRLITLITVDETLELVVPDNMVLEEILRGKKIPPSLFQAYICDTDTNSDLYPIPLNTNILSIPKEKIVILRCIRNTDFRDIIPQQSSIKKVINPVTYFSDIKIGDEGSSETIYEINSETAKDLVKERVGEFMKEYSSSDIIVAGISGGGDSNTLVQSLVPLNKMLICYTIVLDPIWPASAAQRAVELCKKYNVKHEVYYPKDLEKLLEMKSGIDDCYNGYLAQFGKDTSHFFGTFLISLVGRKVCQINNAQEFALGFNREDLLSDILYSIMNGQKPLSFPVRQFGDIKLIMPLWEMPKSILDACYPKYSLSNYKERDKDESTYQRNMMYYLAHGVEDVFPNMGLSIMTGLQKLFANNWATLKSDDFGLFVSEYAENSKIGEMKEFLSKYF